MTTKTPTTKPAAKKPAANKTTPKTTRRRTPADVPAETTVAQRSEYDAAVPVAQVHLHPDNPRHDAVADDALIASIDSDHGLIHALVVAPHPDQASAYVLLDGHRRFDAVQRLGWSHVPAVVRHDLADRVDQVAVMVASTERKNLSPVEEAEAFDLLSELGLTLDAIAAKTKWSKSKISERRKLTRLPEKARAAADTGQITIDEATRIAALPATVQKDLEKVVHSSDFRHKLTAAEDKEKRRAAIDEKIAEHKAAGAIEQPWPKGAHTAYYLSHAEHGMVRLESTGVTDPARHDGCLAYTVHESTYYTEVHLVCTNPARHDDDLDDARREQNAQQAAAEAEREARRAAWEEKRRADDLARQLRTQTVVDAAVAKLKLTDAFTSLVAHALPGLLREYHVNGSFGVVAGVPEDARWVGYHGALSAEAWIDALPTAKPADLVRVLAAFLADTAEQSLTQDDVEHASSWYGLLTSLGHDMSTVDEAFFSHFFGEQETAS